MNQPRIIVAFGDSITKGDSVAPHERFPALAEHALNQSVGNIRIINAGVNADITALARQRLERDVIAHAPEVVTIMFGVNDAGFFRPDGPPADTPRVSPEAYRQNLERMIEPITASGARVLLGTPLPMSPSYPLADLPLYKVHGLNYLVDLYAGIMREVASEHDVPLMDFHEAFAADTSTQAFLPDGIHPNVEGHAFLARMVVEGLEGVLT